MKSSKEDTKTWGKLIAKLWEDKNLKERLLSNPGPVLKENGIEIPDGIEVRVVENTDKVVYLMLPAKPNYEELLDIALNKETGRWRPWPFCATISTFSQ